MALFHCEFSSLLYPAAASFKLPGNLTDHKVFTQKVRGKTMLERRFQGKEVGLLFIVKYSLISRVIA
jgi:hypothetical protein